MVPEFENAVKALEGLLGRMLAAKEESETPVTLPGGQTVPARAILFTTCAGHYVTLTLRGEQSLRVRTTQNAMAAARLPRLCGLQQGHTG